MCVCVCVRSEYGAYKDDWNKFRFSLKDFKSKFQVNQKSDIARFNFSTF